MNVYQAFSSVQKEMSEHGIAKGQKNQQQKYAYRGIDDVYNTLGPILAKHGVLIIPRVMASEQTPGQKGCHWKVIVEYNVYGPEGDRLEPVPLAHGECIDYSDKGLNKACSAAYKYWVLSSLCVPLEGQEEADSVTPDNFQAASGELSSDQRKEILGLCMQTNTNVEQFIGWLGYNTMGEIPAEKFEYAKDALRQKLTKMSQDYAVEQQQTAQSMGN